MRDIAKAKALAIKLEDELVDPKSDGAIEETKPDTTLDSPVKALTERGSEVVEDTITRLLEQHGLNAETLSEEQANVKVSLMLPCAGCR